MKIILTFFNNYIEFFDLFYNKKFKNLIIKMKYTEKKIYFRDIIIFIDRIKNIIRVKDVKLIRNNL